MNTWVTFSFFPTVCKTGSIILKKDKGYKTVVIPKPSNRSMRSASGIDRSLNTCLVDEVTYLFCLILFHTLGIPLSFPQQ